ncbi:MAG: universal stress protein [Actinomycetota bacterium]|nr:universal stress protein [Actinomycetota bacterium]
MATPQSADPPPPLRRIVVGVDGSPASLAALRWAVQEASSRGGAVHAVTAWELPVESTFGDMRTVGDFHPVIAAEEILVTALADAGVSTQDQTVTTAAVEGHPAEVLLQAAEDSELLVVGSRGHGKILGALLGSVSQYVTAHASCPVVVINPLADETGSRCHPEH